jgi:hypothetical protein
MCLAVVAGTGCKKKKSDPPIVIPPNLDIWDDPGAPNALLETDGTGDHAYGGDSADLTVLQGTYDAFYVYLWVDVASTPNIDTSGDTGYDILVDADGDGYIGPGDFYIQWDPVGGLLTVDLNSGNPVALGVVVQVDPDGGIDYIIPRGLVNQTSFDLGAATWFWDGADWQLADELPDGAMATFTF